MADVFYLKKHQTPFSEVTIIYYGGKKTSLSKETDRNEAAHCAGELSWVHAEILWQALVVRED